MSMSDAEFEKLLAAALVRANELDYEEIPSDEELHRIIKPSQRFLRRKNAFLRNPNKFIRNQRKPIYLRVLQNVAAVFIVLTILLGAAMAVSPTVRAAVIDFVRSWFEDRTEYWTPEDDAEYEFSFGYIPEGFELLSEQVVLTDSIRVFKNGHDETIKVMISQGTHIIDNEHSVYYQTSLNGRVTYVYESVDPQYSNRIMLYDNTAGVVIAITSTIGIDELIKMAESID